jgi:hypothetical protein
MALLQRHKTIIYFRYLLILFFIFLFLYKMETHNLSNQQIKELVEHEDLVKVNKEAIEEGKITIYDVLDYILTNAKKSIEDSSLSDIKVFINNLHPYYDTRYGSKVQLLRKLKSILKEKKYNGLMNGFDIMIYSRYHKEIPEGYFKQFVEAMKDNYHLNLMNDFCETKEEYETIFKFLVFRKLNNLP